jgi:glutamate-5-semialdehyde dehydrogenase
MQEVINRLKEIKKGSIALRTLNNDTKNLILEKLSFKLVSHEAEILIANEKDIKAYALNTSFQKAFADRLVLNSLRIKQMTESIEAVINASDPIGKSIGKAQLNNGLSLEQIRGPLGVCFMIFESRPNVITEAFSLALKSSNALILKGGKESDATAQCLYQLITESLSSVFDSQDVFWGMVGASRETTDFLIKQHRLIDVLIPRGGNRLIEYVTENSSLPLIKNDRGLCHVYVHEKADQDMALQIVDNAKTQRPGVCNSMETLLVDEQIANAFIPRIYKQLKAKGVEFYVCEESKKILNIMTLQLVTNENFNTEYLDLKINIKVVKSVTAAREHIEKYGSGHSEAIITEDRIVAEDFLKKVDAAVVYWNASTRFTDGYQFGLGGEMGISTQKLHVRGPVGLEALTVPRWIVKGHGQIRES